MPDLAATLRAAQVTSRKAGDKDRTLLLGTVLAALKNRELDSANALTDTDVVEVIRKQIKQRIDSVDQFSKAGRTDLAAREQAEIDALKPFLPAEIDPSFIRAVADEAVAGGTSEIGPLMALLMSRFKGQADGGLINRIAREALPRK
jgi:uncharacterized protein YqeY